MPYDQRHMTEKNHMEKTWSLKRLAVIISVAASFAFFITGTGDWITRDTLPPSFSETDAVVVSSEIESSTIAGKSLSEKPTVYYSAMITFKYSIQGTEYTSHRTVGNISRNDHAPVQAIVSSYSPGTLIPIVYNKNNPEESKIRTQSFPTHFLHIAAGIFCIILSVVFYVFIPDYLPKKSKPGQPHQTPLTERKEPDSAKIITPRTETPAVPAVPDEVKPLLGSWTLLYQIPSMREIISSSLTANSAMGADIQAVMNAGAESLTINITPGEMEFIYMDSKLQGSCDIVSRFTCTGNRLDLEHISMDFLIADVAGFPPSGYTYEIKEYKLTLKSDGVPGLGGRPIVYILSRNEPEKTS